MMTVVNHVGLCVRDLDRSRRFYTEALGFTFERALRPPDDLTGQLLAIDPPVGLTAEYLTLGPFTLELLHFDREGNPDPRARQFNETGLTHLSITTDDLPNTLERVRAAGGEVVESTDIGLAVMVQDPDGQLVELLPLRTAVT
jgi:lactoylglutathione lyase